MNKWKYLLFQVEFYQFPGNNRNVPVYLKIQCNLIMSPIQRSIYNKVVIIRQFHILPVKDIFLGQVPEWAC